METLPLSPSESCRLVTVTSTGVRLGFTTRTRVLALDPAATGTGSGGTETASARGPPEGLAPAAAGCAMGAATARKAAAMTATCLTLVRIKRAVWPTTSRARLVVVRRDRVCDGVGIDAGADRVVDRDPVGDRDRVRRPSGSASPGRDCLTGGGVAGVLRTAEGRIDRRASASDRVAPSRGARPGHRSCLAGRRLREHRVAGAAALQPRGGVRD